MNFAPPDWLPWGLRGVERYRVFHKNPVFSHDELCLRIAENVCNTVSTYSWLQKTLVRLRDEECRLREMAYLAGTTRGRRWNDGLLAPAVREDEDSKEPGVRGRYQKDQSANALQTHCVICRHAVYSSCVWCECRPTDAACLRHGAQLCECSPDKRRIVFRYSLVCSFLSGFCRISTK